MMKPRKIPMRMCVGCREMKPKRELVRIVRPPDGGAPSIDPRGKNPGRGAYVCVSIECLKKAKKSKALERALETSIPPEIFETLERDIAGLPPPEPEPVLNGQSDG